MANLRFTQKGLYVIDLTIEECAKCGFGFVENGQLILLCNMCNSVINKKPDSVVHFVPVLNDTYCDECMKYIEKYENYSEDLEFQKEVYERFMNTYKLDNLKPVDEKWYKEKFSHYYEKRNWKRDI